MKLNLLLLCLFFSLSAFASEETIRFQFGESIIKNSKNEILQKFKILSSTREDLTGIKATLIRYRTDSQYGEQVETFIERKSANSGLVHRFKDENPKIPVSLKIENNRIIEIHGRVTEKNGSILEFESKQAGSQVISSHKILGPKGQLSQVTHTVLIDIDQAKFNSLKKNVKYVIRP